VNDNPFPLIVILFIFLLYLVCAIAGWVTDFQADVTFDLKETKAIEMKIKREKSLADRETEQKPRSRWFKNPIFSSAKGIRVNSTVQKPPTTVRSAFIFALTDEHRWIRIFTRKPKVVFSRPRRIILLWSYVMSVTACNAIFYQAKHDTLLVPLDWRTVLYNNSNVWTDVYTDRNNFLIGLWGCLLCTPINLVLLLLLQKSRPRSMQEPTDYMKEELDYDADLDKLEEVNKYIPNDPQKWKRILKKCMHSCKNLFNKLVFGTWPWWCAIIGYVLSLCVVGFSAYIVLLYALMFSSVSVSAWVASSSISMLIDIIVSQPVMNIAFALFNLYIRNI